MIKIFSHIRFLCVCVWLFWLCHVNWDSNKVGRGWIKDATFSSYPLFKVKKIYMGWDMMSCRYLSHLTRQFQLEGGKDKGELRSANCESAKKEIKQVFQEIVRYV